MKIMSVRHIDGPNVFLYKPILMARISLESYTERESYEFPGFTERLLETLPGLCEHHCAKGAPGGFVERLFGGTYFGHVVEHVTIELATLAGLDVHYGKTVYAGGLGVYDIAMECKAYQTQRLILEHAVHLVDDLARGQRVDIHPILEMARRCIAKTELGPSTMAIVEAAIVRGIPVRRLGEGSLVQLGFGKNLRRIEATVTANTSAIAVDIASDKSMTKHILEEGGIPVPYGGVAHDATEAVDCFRRIGSAVAIKPYNGNQGRGVTLKLQHDEDVIQAYRIASTYSERAIIEQYIEGMNVRLLVVGGQCIAVAERVPAHIVGDGKATIRQKITEVNCNPARGVGHEKRLTMIHIDPVVEATLRRQGLSLDDIVPAEHVVYLRDSANLSTGGEARDITDELHASYLVLAARAARLIGLDVCGVDMVIQDYSVPATDENCAVIEINAAPGIRMHQFPSLGQPRDVGAAIVDALFPNGRNGRIPIVSVTGTNGKTTTTRLIGHMLAKTGKTVGMTTTDGVFIQDRRVLDGDTTGPQSARAVLADPAVEVAVLETARGGIVRGGLAYDKANVSVLTNLTVDHVGQDGVESLDDLLRIKSLVAECVEEDGVVVLNADDDTLVCLSKRLKARVVYFTRSDNNAIIQRHLALGGTAYYVSRGWIVEARGNLTWDVAPVQNVPLTMGGTAVFQVENCLAAVAASRAMGLTRQQIARALESFAPDVQNRGRCMIYAMPSGGHVVLDYGHNPDGFIKVGAWLEQTPHRRLIGVVGVPGDRANTVVYDCAAKLGSIFDAFVVKEDIDKRGRSPLEIANILSAQIRSKFPNKPCMQIENELEAAQEVVSQLQEGDIAVVFYEKLEPLDELVQRMGGKAVTRIENAPIESRVAMIR